MGIDGGGALARYLTKLREITEKWCEGKAGLCDVASCAQGWRGVAQAGRVEAALREIGALSAEVAVPLKFDDYEC